ncbi:MAG TPA: D-alanyl-lipoteichoic acid biosynthesis protein DltB [Bacillota bacterium]|nr:D-alanyl-lipoteichoic acid biosynthesis protein DltB [Bacillota bacterium]
MTPYASFGYFIFLLYPALPLLVLGFTGRLGRWSIVLVSAAVLAIQFWNPLGASGLRQLAYFAGYIVWSLAIIYGLRTRYYLAVALALLPLVAVKVLEGRAAAGGLPAGLADTVGFLGISYLTFRVLDVIVLIHDRVLDGPPVLGELLAYLLFFPTISAGPIDRYRRFVADLRAREGGYAAHTEKAIHRVAQGFLYKYIFAYLVYRYALQPVASQHTLGADVIYMYAYSAYLFFDFAGYSAFAIGAGHLLGITVPENFAGPFLSPNFREMWNRWHMTLSFWFRDHVYMRFVLGATKKRWFHGNRHAASYAGFMVTMGLMGLWHGLAWNYIVYGLFQGVMLVAYDFLSRWNRRRRALRLPAGVAKAAGILLTANLFCFGLLIFSGHLFH